MSGCGSFGGLVDRSDDRFPFPASQAQCPQRIRRQHMSTGPPETAASVTVISLGYRALCTEPGCASLGRQILRHAGAGGRPMSNTEFCYEHGRWRVERNQAAGLKVYDDRQTPKVQ
jgi:hypothetical protein